MNKENKKETREERKKRRKKLAKLLIIATVVYLFLSFPPLIIKYNGVSGTQRILVLGLGSIQQHIWTEGEGYMGLTIGNYVLQTEYGEITLNNFCKISSKGRRVSYIFSESFEDGKALHNLAIDGIQMPASITVWFHYDNGKIGAFEIDHQEVNISGIFFDVSIIRMALETSSADALLIGSNYPKEGIALADSTQIFIVRSRTNWRSSWRLYIYLEEGKRTLEVYDKENDFFSVKFPNEDEYRKYTSITFKREWGEFIEGVLFEGE